MILSGKEIALNIENKLKEKVNNFSTKPVLATIIVGNKKESVVYVNMKLKACERIGIIGKKIELSEDITEEELVKEIEELNNDSNITGILIQHPLPSHLNEQKIFNTIALDKDVDGLNSTSFGNMALGLESNLSATPAAIMELLKYYNITVAGKNVVIVGRSSILGKPIAMLLLNEDATVTICHSKTNNLEEFLKKADILVAAIGEPKYIKAKLLKSNAIIIDAGYNEGNIGDVDLDEIDSSISYTPVPGGIGPITISKLLEQTVNAYERRNYGKNS
ncbi:MAG TPA: bifunctional 5,10-methylenetetrahydrofolate dehydrogenase/5,10-methenyltetrahydrofolate cyclohydrolase [Bacilli bacterium]|nr:bifunctional 5,10-methylenetetrahydrofolate dehydrogenase/5,10-methenyltetrahydrofolate cyclohydrolase [Bacilli bacterium]